MRGSPCKFRIVLNCVLEKLTTSVKSAQSELEEIKAGVPMPEVIFNGPAGRLEGRYQPSKEKARRLPSFCTRTPSSAAR
jgi:hypothetical protein